MHELSVTESILNIAVQYATQAGATRVTDLYLVIGRLSSIVDDSVQFYWEIVTAENPLLVGSVLHIQRVPAELLCLDCSQPYTLDGELTPCPACGSPRVKVTSGDQFFLDSIEIETSPTVAGGPAAAGGPLAAGEAADNASETRPAP